MKRKYIDLANKYGTPIYVYEYEVICEKIRNLRKVLYNSKIFYSMKANPNPHIIKRIGKIVDGIEVSSLGEYIIAKENGILPENIIFSGPAKENKDLQYIVSQKIRCIHVNSINEIININKICERKNIRCSVALRINVLMKLSAGIRMTGVASQFGMDKNEIIDTLNIMHRLENIDLIGIQFFGGTQILDYKDVIANIRCAIDMARKISKLYQCEFRYINFGGGFGVSYFKNDKELELNILHKEIIKIFEENKDFLSGMTRIFESGRYIMAEKEVLKKATILFLMIRGTIVFAIFGKNRVKR